MDTGIKQNVGQKVGTNDVLATFPTEDLLKMLNSEYKVYSYITSDHEPGTIIIDPRLQKVFDENKLFKMEVVKSETVKLRDILEKGFVSVGSVDLMETLKIVCPNPCLLNSGPESESGSDSLTAAQGNVIKGKYLHGSRERLISEPTGLMFEYDPVSDHEHGDFSENEESEESGNSGNSNTVEKSTGSVKSKSDLDKKNKDNNLNWLCE